MLWMTAAAQYAASIFPLVHSRNPQQPSGQVQNADPISSESSFWDAKVLATIHSESARSARRFRAPPGSGGDFLHQSLYMLFNIREKRSCVRVIHFVPLNFI